MTEIILYRVAMAECVYYAKKLNTAECCWFCLAAAGRRILVANVHT
jgi:hypothetical protein